MRWFRFLNWPLVLPVMLAALALLAAWRIFTRPAAAESNELKVAFLDVGQGDSALVQGPDGFDVLIDGGEATAGPGVAAYLRQEGVDDLEVMLASHNDADHIGGLVHVLELEDIPVRQVLYNGYPADSEVFRAFATAAALEGAPLAPAQIPISYTWGAARAYILNPPANLPGEVEQNNASVTVLLEFGEQKFLFPGDLEASGENQLLLRGTPVDAQFLKVAHHGSDSSTTLQFLQAVQPIEAVISVGQNSFGHPAEEVIERLKAAGARLWRTDESGNIWVVTDGVSYQVQAQVMNPVRLPLVSKNFHWTAQFGRLDIRDIFYNGAINPSEPDEYVEIVNRETYSLQVAGWTLRDQDNRVYTFPETIMAPGQVCRVYTNEDHPEWCGFNWGSSLFAVWDNSGECGYLRDPSGAQIDEFCYP
jgi:competence protein ComEC